MAMCCLGLLVMPPTQKTRLLVWVKSGGACAMCRDRLVLEEQGVPSTLIGDIAHIVAESDGGPRGLSSLTFEERMGVPFWH